MIVLHPNEILARSCTPVKDFGLFDEAFKNKLSIMQEFAGKFCIDNDMLGVAANQLGFSERFFLFWDLENGCNEIAVNPIPLSIEGPHDLKVEGCLSLPGQQYIVTRPKTVTISYASFNNNWKHVTRTFSDLGAQIMCHEIDHLNGKLIIDHGNRERIPTIL